MSLSQSDTLVYFDTKTKKFIPCNRYEDAIQLVTTAPEGWYIALKNPAPGNKHPQPGTSNSIPENMEIGKKINIPGPISFALYPGQMAQVIKDAIFEAERARKEKDNDLELAHKKQMLELEATREAAAAEAMKTVLAALGPDLAAALKTSGNQAVVESIAGAIAPYAIAEGKPVSRAVSELLRGTTLESVFEDFAKKNN